VQSPVKTTGLLFLKALDRKRKHLIPNPFSWEEKGLAPARLKSLSFQERDLG
jgi:hypothetical protein